MRGTSRVSRQSVSPALIRRSAGVLLGTLLAGATLSPSVASADKELGVVLTAAETSSVTLEILLFDRAALKILRSLEEGLPVQVSYNLEVWNHRSRWFDRLTASQPITYLVRLDPWSDAYQVESPDFPARSFVGVTELAGWLSRQGPFEMMVKPQLDPRRSYYLAAQAAITPLTEEQVGAVERWLGGGDGDQRGITGVFFDVALRFSGLDDLKVRGESARFTPRRPDGG